jgi:endoglucanase
MVGRIDDTHKSQQTAVLAAIVVGVAVIAVGVALQLARGPYGKPLDVTGVGELDEIASKPIATWITSTDAATSVRDAVTAADSRDSVALLVAYAIPGRDCGSYSAAAEDFSAAEYRDWVASFVDGLGETKAVIVVEPDALAQLDCLSSSDRVERLSLLHDAVSTLAATGSWVYLDAGHSGWIPAAEMASRLDDAGVENARGFSLNVSNFRPTADETAYGTAISEKLSSPAQFVIDTSRNGAPIEAGTWCNPPGAALGAAPTTATGSQRVDAWLWVKTPGRSDGECNGGPKAGEWWNEYAEGLVRNASSAAN